MRTFIAIRIEPDDLLVQTLAGLRQKLKHEPVKWVDQHNLHLTLKFLGETSDIQVHQVKGLLGKMATQHRPVSFIPEGLGYFKSRGMPRVLFVDIKDGDSLKQLAAGVDILVSPLGFEKESRPFNPHLTLARIKFLKNKKAFFEAVGKYQNLQLQPVTVNEIIFYQSQLKPEGPVYHELAKYTLSGII